MASKHAKVEKEAPVYRREFRIDPIATFNDPESAMAAEALALGFRPTGAPVIESDQVAGRDRVMVWAMPVEAND